MASPSRDFDPNRKYKLVLSDRLKHAAAAGTVSSAIHLPSSLKLPSNVKSAAITRSATTAPNKVSLRLNDTTTLRGTHAVAESAALFFDPATQTFTLDSIDSEFTFTEAAPAVPTAASDPEGSPSDEDLIESLEAGAGSPDPDNPFDWRHQLRKGSKFEPFDPLSLDSLRTPSPEPLSARSRGPRSPEPSSARAVRSPDPGAARNTLSPQPAARPKPPRSPLVPTKRERPAPRPARQASTPPSEPSDIDLANTPTGSSPAGASPSPPPPADRRASPSPSLSASPPAPSPKKAKASKRSPSPSDSSDSGGGGLEIVDAGTASNGRDRGRFAHRALLATAGDGPISLRSAANSRSPALRDAEDYDSGAESPPARGTGGSLGGGTPMGRVTSSVAGGPASSPVRETVEATEDADADADVEMGDDDDLEAAFAAAEEDLEGEDEGGVPLQTKGYVDESSSESEEE